MAIHNTLGAEGERIAQEFLIKQGMIIRETNWRIGHLEIDIIAETPGRLHIVEVKSRTSDEKFDPLLSITPKKIRNLVAAANAYLNYTKLDIDVQFDVMLIIGSENIEFIPDAFYPPLKTYR
jgi:putative endonuclease